MQQYLGDRVERLKRLGDSMPVAKSSEALFTHTYWEPRMGLLREKWLIRVLTHVLCAAWIPYIMVSIVVSLNQSDSFCGS